MKEYFDKIEEKKLPALRGVFLATEKTGLKYKNRDDLCLFFFEKEANVAGVFTKSLCPSAPVDYCRKILPHGSARAILINSGNANAFTGNEGTKTVSRCVNALSEKIDCKKEEIYIASTGVIGEILEDKKIIEKFDSLLRNLDANDWLKAAEAIRTTDKYEKMAFREIFFNEEKITINGIAKGAGMIAPDMATMLSFIVTDADIPSPLLQKMLQKAVDQSFNCISVDNDMSTSDTVLCLSTKNLDEKSKIKKEDEPKALIFQEALNDLMLELALMIVSDGEGAKHLIEVNVKNAISDQSAKKIGFSIANSPLVKTAIAGEDANWGRIVMAIGKAGEKADRDLLSIFFGSCKVAENGKKCSNYDEKSVSLYMKNKIINITVDLNIGHGCAKVYGCDLTKEYVALNGDYRS